MFLLHYILIVFKTIVKTS